MLRANGGIAGQQEPAAELQVDRTNLVGLLNELEAEGLIVRRRASEDRRRHIVELTVDGGCASAAAESGRAPDCAGAAVEREPEC